MTLPGKNQLEELSLTAFPLALECLRQTLQWFAQTPAVLDIGHGVLPLLHWWTHELTGVWVLGLRGTSEPLATVMVPLLGTGT